jgi:hypothetical protein
LREAIEGLDRSEASRFGLQVTRRLELVRVEVERDARPCVTELTRRANRIDSCADQVTRERVPEIVKPELGHTVAVEARGLCRSVETALSDVVAAERRPTTRLRTVPTEPVS